MTFQAQRLVRSYRQTIEASPEVVFPLLCPVREVEWLEGWTFEWIYSASGLAEPGGVFRTSSAGEADTVWVITRHDRAEGVVQFTRFTPGSRTCVLTISVASAGAARSYVDVSYAYTSIGEAGNVFLAGWTEEAFRSAMVFWERSMNSYCRNASLEDRSIRD